MLGPLENLDGKSNCIIAPFLTITHTIHTINTFLMEAWHLVQFITRDDYLGRRSFNIFFWKNASFLLRYVFYSIKGDLKKLFSKSPNIDLRNDLKNNPTSRTHVVPEI